eukprot:8770940-Lingulodinium_polyedra.AAC.1
MPANNAEQVEPPPQVVAKGIWIMMQSAGKDGLKVPFYRKVLLDSRANEIIGPYSHQWWVNMKHGKS